MISWHPCGAVGFNRFQRGVAGSPLFMGAHYQVTANGLRWAGAMASGEPHGCNLSLLGDIKVTKKV